MRQACMVAKGVQKQQQVVHAYSSIARTTSPAHPQGCFSSLPEIQTVLECLHTLPLQSHASARESGREGSTLWPQPIFHQQAWQDFNDNSAKLCREDDQVLFFYFSQTSHDSRPLEAEGEILTTFTFYTVCHIGATLFIKTRSSYHLHTSNTQRGQTLP